MKTIEIPKRSGGVRTVVVPSASEKKALRAILSKLTAAAIASDLHDVQHGFIPARSPVTNAKEHIGFEITLSWDLADCFGHLTREVVEQVAKVPDICYVDGVARQGLPTSPAVCNIALSGLDNRIMSLIQMARQHGMRCVYTRYADDLTISCDDRKLVEALLAGIPSLCEKYGTPVSPGKTRVQYARAGRRHVTGVAVDAAAIHPTRAAKRRLRAARHQGRLDAARGSCSITSTTPRIKPTCSEIDRPLTREV